MLFARKANVRACFIDVWCLMNEDNTSFTKSQALVMNRITSLIIVFDNRMMYESVEFIFRSLYVTWMLKRVQHDNILMIKPFSAKSN